MTLQEQYNLAIRNKKRFYEVMNGDLGQKQRARAKKHYYNCISELKALKKQLTNNLNPQMVDLLERYNFAVRSKEIFYTVIKSDLGRKQVSKAKKWYSVYSIEANELVNQMKTANNDLLTN